MPFRQGSFLRTNGKHTGTEVWQRSDADHGELRHEEHDLHDQDMADGINLGFPKAGEKPSLADLDMDTNRLERVGLGSAPTDLARYSEEVTGLSLTLGIQINLIYANLASEAVGTFTAPGGDENLIGGEHPNYGGPAANVSVSGSDYELFIEAAGTSGDAVTYPGTVTLWETAEAIPIGAGHSGGGANTFTVVSVFPETYFVPTLNAVTKELPKGLVVVGRTNTDRGSSFTVNTESQLPEDGATYVLWPTVNQQSQDVPFNEVWTVGEAPAQFPDGSRAERPWRDMYDSSEASIGTPGSIFKTADAPLVMIFVRESDTRGTFHLMRT